MKKHIMPVIALALLATSGVSFADDPYDKARANAIERGKAIKATQEKADADAAARQRAQQAAAAEEARARASKAAGTGQQATVPAKAVSDSKTKVAAPAR